jgi:hypothetical protein
MVQEPPDPAGDRVIDQTGGGQKTGILIHSNILPTKPLRPQDLMSRTKNDPLEPDAKLKRKEYERKPARRTARLLRHAYL